MKKFMDKMWGKEIDKAVAFSINFNNTMILSYDSESVHDYYKKTCLICNYREQVKDFEAPKKYCKKDYAILSFMHYGVSETLKKELLNKFDISEDDFRPIWNKENEIVYWQITPGHTMLPIFEVNNWEQLKPCSKCQKVQYRVKEMYNEQAEEYYFISKEALDEMKDINITYEKFERAVPLFVVSRRVYAFLSEKYPKMEFRPLFLKD